MPSKIAIVIAAEDKTKPAFASASAALNKLGKDAESLKTSFGGIASALGVGISAAAFVSFTKGIVNGLDKLNDLKDATGASVENLSALEDIAVRTGTSMDTAGDAIVKMNKALSDAKPGSDQANSLKLLGLSIKELKQLDPVEAFQKIAVALQGYADDGNKARLVQELFGKSLREIAPLLKDVGEAGRLVATVTREQAEAAEKLNKQFFAMQKNTTDLARDLMSKLLPAVNNVFDAYKKFGGVGGIGMAILGFDETSQAESDAKRLQAEVNRTADAVARMAEELSRDPGNEFLAGRIDRARTRLAGLIADAGEASNKLKKLVGADMDALRRQEDRGFAPTRPSVGGTGGAALVKGKAERLGIAGPPLDRVEAFRMIELAAQAKVNEALATEQLTAAEKELAAARKPAEERFKRLMDMLAATPTAKLEGNRADMLLLVDAFNEGTISAEQFGEAAQAALGNIGPAAQEAADEMQIFAEQAARNIQDALGNTLQATMEGNFKSIGDMWLSLINRMVAEALAANIGKALFGDFGKSGNMGGWIGSLLGAAASAKGNAFGPGGVLAYAAGGVITSPTLFKFGRGSLGLMGEAGPEAILPLKRGAGGRLGVQASGGQSGPVTHNYNFTINGPTDRRSQDQIAAAVGRSVARATARY